MRRHAPQGVSLPALSPVEYSVIWAWGVIRPTARVVPTSVNHRLPSGPGARPDGLLPELSPVLYSLI